VGVRGPPPDFRFIYGTCAYINEPMYDRPGTPFGKTMETFRLMGESGADFMLWGGDNWYYREADYDSISGLWYRAQRTRAQPELRRLFASMPHYATWDDHDYGSNDANQSYELKDETLRIFRTYWGNPSYGEKDQPGVYTKFTWGDAAFFLMDNRWSRDDDHLEATAIKRPKTQYGNRSLPPSSTRPAPSNSSSRVDRSSPISADTANHSPIIPRKGRNCSSSSSSTTSPASSS
jgi:alkaline phosphatase D